MESELKRTSLYEMHQKLKANIIDFHGILMPIFYSSIQDEHNTVRSHVGLFDVSHMGNISIDFPDKETAIEKLNYLLANDFSKIVPGKAIYSIMLYENGTVVDDLMVMAISETRYHIIVNYTNIDKDFQHIQTHLNDAALKITNLSEALSIIAIQGPQASQFLDQEFHFPVAEIKPFRFKELNYLDGTILLARTGYTGENGFEAIIENDKAVRFYQQLLEKGQSYQIKPCGLGARDTLRLEAALPLYGQEFDEHHLATQSMMKWSVKLNKENFVGKKAILENSDQYPHIMVGFEVNGKAIPRTGMEILNNNDQVIGSVTSGSIAPTLKKNIGLGYIEPGYENEKDLKIKVRNRIIPITIAALPFYQRSKK